MAKVAVVVDDNADNVTRLQEILKARGYVVVTATTLKDAKSKIISYRDAGLDLIVTDLDLGRTLMEKHRAIDGYRLLRWCKQQGVKAKTILHSTAFEHENRVASGLSWVVRKHAHTLGAKVQAKSVLLKPRSK